MKKHNSQKHFAVESHVEATRLDMWPGDTVTVNNRSVWTMTATGKLEFLRYAGKVQNDVRKAG